MLFRKDIEKDCSYCAHGSQDPQGGWLCDRNGTTQAPESCRKFQYDPMKRRPRKAKAPDFSKYDDRDFSL